MSPRSTALTAVALVAVVALLISAQGRAQGEGAPTDRLDSAALLTASPAAGVVFDVARFAGAPVGAAGAVRLVAVGDRGRILISDDSAASWRQAPSPVSVELTAVAFNGAGVGVAVGHDGAILRSADAGESWVVIADGRALFPRVVDAARQRVAEAEAALEAAEEADREDAAFVLDDETFRLETAEASTAFGPSWPFLDVYWADEETVWAIGAYGLAFVSETAGERWRLAADRFDNFEDFHYYSMLRARSGALVVVGEAGVIFTSSDDGESWERFDTDVGASLFGAAEIGAADDPTLVAYGFGDTYQISRDGGGVWESRDLGVTAILVGHVRRGATSADAERVRALGASGQMIELGVDGVGRKSQPTGDRSFLSMGVELAGANQGKTLIASEVGLHLAEGAGE